MADSSGVFNENGASKRLNEEDAAMGDALQSTVKDDPNFLLFILIPIAAIVIVLIFIGICKCLPFRRAINEEKEPLTEAKPKQPLQPLPPPQEQFHVYLPAGTGSNESELTTQFFAFVRSTQKIGVEQHLASMNHGSRLVVPCINASRLGSDVEGALGRATLPGDGRYVLLVLHPRAAHRSSVYASQAKLDLPQTVTVIDAVFFNNEVYECEQNRKAALELTAALRTLHEEKYP